jgi:hypothetical protein
MKERITWLQSGDVPMLAHTIEKGKSSNPDTRRATGEDRETAGDPIWRARGSILNRGLLEVDIDTIYALY